MHCCPSTRPPVHTPYHSNMSRASCCCQCGHAAKSYAPAPPPLPSPLVWHLGYELRAMPLLSPSPPRSLFRRSTSHSTGSCLQNYSRLLHFQFPSFRHEHCATCCCFSSCGEVLWTHPQSLLFHLHPIPLLLPLLQIPLDHLCDLEYGLLICHRRHTLLDCTVFPDLELEHQQAPNYRKNHPEILPHIPRVLGKPA